MKIMTDNAQDIATQMLIKHEGVKHKPYICPAGKLTIGVGRNIEDNGLSNDEILYLLNNDVYRCLRELHDIFPDFQTLTANRQAVLIDMIFNLGKTRFLQFRKTIHHIVNRQYTEAAAEMLRSRWAVQVKGRAVTLSEMMRKG
jgi:lysozyme